MVATEFMREKGRPSVGGDQGGVLNLGIRPDIIEGQLGRK